MQNIRHSTRGTNGEQKVTKCDIRENIASIKSDITVEICAYASPTYVCRILRCF